MNIKHPSHICWKARVVVGLLAMGYGPRDAEGLCGMLRCADAQSLGEFMEELIECEHPVVSHCVQHGLPACATAKIPAGRILCPCGAMIDKVNCVICAPPDRWASAAIPFADIRSPIKTKDPRPTDTMPGTPEKIAILRKRVARGEDLHHDEDRKLSLSEYADIMSLLED